MVVVLVVVVVAAVIVVVALSLVFGFFRFAAILQGVLKRAVDGNASSSKAYDYGALAPVLARQALELIE